MRLKAYDRPVEEWKDELFFHTPASLTGTLGGIAATGSLILWPTPQEPRLMSLVPPFHIALLKASEVHDNLFAVMRAHDGRGAPTALTEVVRAEFPDLESAYIELQSDPARVGRRLGASGSGAPRSR